MADSAFHPGFNSTLDPAYAKESNTAAIEAGLGFLTLMVTVVVLLRIYVRVVMIKTVGADDYTILIALLCAIGAYAAFVAQGFYGLGKHKSTIHSENLVIFQKIQFAQTIMNAMVGQCLVKVSVALMLMRFAARPLYRNFSLGCNCILNLVFQCIPIAGFWDPEVRKTAKCYPFAIFLTLGEVSTVLNITTDVLFSTLPIPLIWQLQLKIRVKISLIAILNLAYCATAAGCAKIVYQVAYASAPDKTFHQSLQVCGFIELCLGIIAASAPTLKPLFKTMLRGESTGNGTSGRGGQYDRFKQRRSLVAGNFRQRESGASSSEAIMLQVFNGKSRA